MIVGKTMKRVNRFRPAFVEKGYAGRRRDGKTFRTHGQVGNVAGNESVGFADVPKDFTLRADQRQTVGGSHDLHVAVCVPDDPVDAEHSIVFDVNGSTHAIGISNVDATIEIADPQLAHGIHG